MVDSKCIKGLGSFGEKENVSASIKFLWRKRLTLLILFWVVILAVGASGQARDVLKLLPVSGKASSYLIRHCHRLFMHLEILHPRILEQELHQGGLLEAVTPTWFCKDSKAKKLLSIKQQGSLFRESEIKIGNFCSIKNRRAAQNPVVTIFYATFNHTFTTEKFTEA